MESNSRTLNLLVYSETPNQAVELSALIRTLGLAVKQTHVNCSSDFSSAIDARQCDLAILILSDDINSVPRTQSSTTPIIALIGESSELTFSDLLDAGIDDVGYSHDKAHVKHLVQRALKLQQLQQQAERQRSQNKTLLSQYMTLLENSNEAIAYIHQGMHLYGNPVYLQAFDIATVEQLQATPFLDFIPSLDDRDDIAKFLRELEAGGDLEELEIEIEVQSELGDKTIRSMSLVPSLFDDETAIQIIVSEEVTEAAEELPSLTSLPAAAQTRHSISDPVTHLFNQQHLLTLLEDTVTHAASSNTEYLLYLIHLETGPDDKEYTNNCMLTAASQLMSVIDDKDVLGRFGGNTFLLLSLYHKHTQPEIFGEKLRAAIGDLDGLLQGDTFSRVAGVVIDRNCKSATDATHRLREVFDMAQELGNTVKIDINQFVHVPERQVMDGVWAQRISTVLKDNRLTLISHPIISLRHDAYDRYTLQLQLSDDDGMDIPLDNFRDTVMNSGLASSVDRWIIFNAAKQLVDYIKETPNTQFFIPLIGKGAPDSELFPWIEKIIEQFRLPSNSIVLETHVDAALDHPEAFQKFTKRMNEMNLSTYLTGIDDPTITPHVLEGEHIKYMSLDPSLLASLPSDTETVEIIVGQAHRFETMVVAPNIEDPEILSVLWKLGVDMIINDPLLDQSDELMELDLTATLSVSTYSAHA